MNVHNPEKHHGNIGYTGNKMKTKKKAQKTAHKNPTHKKHSTICVEHHYAQTITTNVNKPSYKQLGVQRNRTS
jgi:hypothetical protein